MDRLEEIRKRDELYNGQFTTIVYSDRRWLLGEVDAQREELRRLREALEWYASLANYMDADPPDYNSRAAHDRGALARRVLGWEE